MFSTKKLMIGDWVFAYGRPRRVEIIYDERIQADCIELSEDEFEPIRLTTEILEKNGFNFGYTSSEEDFCSAVGCGYPEDKGWCYDEGAGEIKIVFPNDTDGGLVRLDDECGNRHIEFNYAEPIMVHDLQHALRLCGITLNIKI